MEPQGGTFTIKLRKSCCSESVCAAAAAAAAPVKSAFSYSSSNGHSPRKP